MEVVRVLFSVHQLLELNYNVQVSIHDLDTVQDGQEKDEYE